MLGHESLNRSPKVNWVERAGQLPAYIQHIAKDIHEERGVPLSIAIPTAIAACKRWAAGGGNVKPDTRAKAAAAIAEWQALKAKSHARNLTAAPAATVDLAGMFTESLHPRAPKGTATGGKFVAKNSGASGEKGVGATYRAQISDFQKRAGLKVTGKMDTATRAKIAKLRKPDTSGGSGTSKKAAAAKKTAAEHARHAATASAVNGLNDLQREQFRILRPKAPPGYHWDHNNRLVRATTQSRRIHKILGLGH